MIVAPSILSADFSILKNEIDSVSNAQYLHIDVMDGHFVPNITIGPVVLNSIKDISLVKDVHLMITDPIKYAPKFIDAGADIVTFHYEALNSDDEILSLIKLIKGKGCKAGISIKPNTSVKVLDQFLDKVDLILVMSVEPGFGGQNFMPSALSKIAYLKDKKLENGYEYLIEVDGGINNETAKDCAKSGVDILVAGTFIFKSDNRRVLIDNLKELKVV